MNYDAPGNMLSEGTGSLSHSYSSDAEGRMTSASWNGTVATYSYKALGQRVQRSGSGIGPYDMYEYYDAFGNLALMGDNTTSNEDLFPRVGGRLYGEYLYYTTFLHANALGSTGVTTGQDGYFIGDEIYDPWGQRWGTYSNLLGERFAEMQRVDKESGLDHTPNRMFTSQYGRWMSPDPLAGDITNPQSLNRYAYVMNNPTSRTDALGLTPACLFRSRHPNVSGATSGCGGFYEGGSGGIVVDSGGGFPAGLFGSGGLAGGESAVQCPGNVCEGINANGQFVYYVASTVGAGYFTYSGPGSLFTNVQAAGLAGALAAQNSSANDPTMREYGGDIYAEAGFYSFSSLQQGPPCDPSKGCEISINIADVPEGATTMGLYHDHPGTAFGSYNFSDVDEQSYIQNGYYGFLATQPAGRVLMFDPNAYSNFYQHGLQPPAECVLQGPLMGMSPCH